MSDQNKNQYAPDASLSDLEIVSSQLSERILSAASIGNHSIREAYIHRYSTSNAEFAAACEMAEDYGLVVHWHLDFLIKPIPKITISICPRRV